jgi:hypothetical protein
VYIEERGEEEAIGEERKEALVLTGVVRGKSKRECCFYVGFVRW